MKRAIPVSMKKPQNTGSEYSTRPLKPAFWKAPKTTRARAIAPCTSIAVRGEPLASSQRPRKPRSGQSRDRKSTRLNSSHSQISYAVFCLKKKKKKYKNIRSKKKKKISKSKPQIYKIK